MHTNSNWIYSKRSRISYHRQVTDPRTTKTKIDTHRFCHRLAYNIHVYRYRCESRIGVIEIDLDNLSLHSTRTCAERAQSNGRMHEKCADDEKTTYILTSINQDDWAEYIGSEFSISSIWRFHICSECNEQAHTSVHLQHSMYMYCACSMRESTRS